MKIGRITNDKNIYHNNPFHEISEFINLINLPKKRNFDLIYKDKLSADRIKNENQGEKRIHCKCFKSRCQNSYCICVESGFKCIDCECKDCKNNDLYFNQRELSKLKRKIKNQKDEALVPWPFKEKEKRNQIKTKKSKYITRGCLCQSKHCSGKQCSCLQNKIFCNEGCFCKNCFNKGK